METFDLQGHEYIELNKLLKRLNWVETGGEANICIEEGEVKVNAEIEHRKRHKLRDGFVVEFREKTVVIRQS